MNPKINYFQVVEEAEHVILDHLPMRVTDEFLARAVGVNVPELRRAFLEVRHAPIYQALYRLRLETVERLVEQDPNRSLDAAALECGFGHLGVFHRRYRRFQALKGTPASLRQLRADTMKDAGE